DVNDNVCAIIKVRPTQAMNAPLIINTAGGMSAVPPPDGVANRQEDGSWWYWLPPPGQEYLFYGCRLYPNRNPRGQPAERKGL
ncbi:MAG: hypothetical protein J6Y32_08255, partial [Bacteroidales bacterium]|nr:hypothetical protein [Bacteroidales bacterium]